VRLKSILGMDISSLGMEVWAKAETGKSPTAKQERVDREEPPKVGQ